MGDREGGALSTSRLANLVASAIVAGFEELQTAFDTISRRAKLRFERRDWEGAAADATERLDLYPRVIDRVEHDMRVMLAERVSDRLAWTATKAVYSGLIGGRPDWELAETFFNSVTRRIFITVGVEPNTEFVDSDFEGPAVQGPGLSSRTYTRKADIANLLEEILHDSGFEAAFEDIRRDCRLADARLTERLGGCGPVQAEIVAAPFFRRKGAYLIGRLTTRHGSVPLVLALLNTERGLVVDAVLCDEDDISILFSFTRSHFHVDSGPPHQLVRFLKGLMPRKSIAEIYIALGYHKHGKTELYRDLLGYLRTTEEKFQLAPGTPGMVMVVFTMPGYDLVFKVIRDRFPAIKPNTTPGVVRNYRLVFRHDRAGRLVEAQEFEHLQFDRARFGPELLEEFRRDADRTVVIDSERVVIHHAYVERRVTPLDLYFRDAPKADALAAVADFGQAVKDLAATGIFPGELLPKNFGLTRHARVVCYDYDELALLTDFSFREMPSAGNYEDDYADEAWFGVGARDVFPQEFSRFLSLPVELDDELARRHPEIYQVGFWQETQASVRRGEIIDIYPYNPSHRLSHGASGMSSRE
jgi:isocitrate dehydrogenase kinase/phosphatase